jgi:hypothetical protein
MNRFDQLCKAQEVQSARETLACYGRHLVRTDIEANDVDFLARAFRGQKERLAQAIEDQKNWWS